MRLIAEIGINHGGSLKEALLIADSAINAGAEIIKHQTHIPEDEMSLEAKKIIPINANKNIYNLIKYAKSTLPKSNVEIISNGDVLSEARLKKLYENIKNIKI